LNYAVLKRGLYYAITQFLTFPGFFVIFAGIATAFRRQRLAAYNVVLALPVSFTIYGIAVSGDFMPMARFLLPAVAFDSILFAWVLSGIGTSTVARKIIYIFTALSVIIASLLPAWNIHLLPQNVREVFHFRGVFVPNYLTEYEMWKIEKNNTERWTEKGKILKNYAKPGDTLVQG
jgi:hypothetical protein